MDGIITKNQEGQEQPQINDIWYGNLTRYGETEGTDVYIGTKVKIIGIDPNHTFTYAGDTTRFTLVEYEFLPPQSGKSSSHINVFLREFTKKERTYVPMPMTAKLANSILGENKKRKDCNKLLNKGNLLYKLNSHKKTLFLFLILNKKTPSLSGRSFGFFGGGAYGVNLRIFIENYDRVAKKYDF